MTKTQPPLTQDQIAAINRLAQRGYGIDRIDEIIPSAQVVARMGWQVTCSTPVWQRICTAYEPGIRPGDNVVCAKVKLYDRPAMRWFCFKSDRAWVLDELTRLGQECGDYE